MKSVKVRLGFVALLLFLVLGVVRESAAIAVCFYNGSIFSNGACHQGQRCSGGTWVNDPSCPNTSAD